MMNTIVKGINKNHEVIVEKVVDYDNRHIVMNEILNMKDVVAVTSATIPVKRQREPEASASSPNNYITWDGVLSSGNLQKNAQKYLPEIV